MSVYLGPLISIHTGDVGASDTYGEVTRTEAELQSLPGSWGCKEWGGPLPFVYQFLKILLMSGARAMVTVGPFLNPSRLMEGTTQPGAWWVRERTV